MNREDLLIQVLLLFPSAIAAALVGWLFTFISDDPTAAVVMGAIGFALVFAVCLLAHYRSLLRRLSIERVYRMYAKAPSPAKLIHEATNRFDFLGISARSLFEIDGFDELLRKRAKEKLKCRFLLLDPASEALPRKAADEGDQPEAWANDIAAQLARLRAISQECGDSQITVHTYHTYPIWRAIILDEACAYVSQYPSGHSGKASPVIKVRNSPTSLFRVVKYLFDSEWSHDGNPS